MAMVVDACLQRQMETHEGRRGRPYKDIFGNVTIGVGHNLSSTPLPDAVINLLLEYDLDIARHDLNTALPWATMLDPIRYRVLVDMCFNLGITKLLGFRTTLSLIQSGDYVSASLQMLKSKWAKQVGKRAATLSHMMLTGIDPFAEAA